MTDVTIDPAPHRRWAHLLTRPRWSPFSVVVVVVAAGLASLAVYPLARVVINLFWSDGSFNADAIRGVLDQPDLLQVLGNTLVLVVVSGSAALVVGSALAWVIERTDARLGTLGDLLPLAPFFLPPVAGAVGWLLLLSDRAGLLNVFLRWVLSFGGIELTSGPFNILTWYGMSLVYMLYMVPYVYVVVAAGLRNMDPSLEEQARVSGAGILKTMRTVTLPGMRPSLGAGLLLVVWLGLAIYSVPSILGPGAEIDVLSVRIVNLTRAYPPQMATAVGLSMFVLVGVAGAYMLQRRLLRSGHHVTVGGKGHRSARIKLGRWQWPVRLMLCGYIFVALVLPVIGLTLVALNGFWSASIDWGALSLDRFRVVWDDEPSKTAILNSLRLGGIGATVGMLGAGLVAVFVQRAKGVFPKVVDAGIKLPAVFSSIVLAVGFVLAFSGPPFNLRGTVLILLLGYLALYLPQGSVAADAAAAQVGKELPEASSVSGARPSRTFFRIYLPVMAPGLIAGWSLLFARMVGDLTMSAVLAGPSNPVVGRKILDVFLTGGFADVAVLSLILTVVTSAVVFAAMVVTRRSSSLGMGPVT